VFNAAGDMAVAAQITGGVSSPLDDQGVWWKPSGGPLLMVTREGAVAPGTSGAKVAKLDSVVLPDGIAGPLILGRLLVGGPGTPAVTKENDQGLWMVDSMGNPLLAVREGHTIMTGAGTKTVKKFLALGKVSASPGQTRSFAAGPPWMPPQTTVFFWARFTDKSEAILKVTVP
jgi:hypothetical protein